MKLKLWLGVPLCAAACLIANTAAAQLAPIVSSAQSYPIDIGTPSTVELIPAVAGKATYVTFAHLEANGVGNFQFKYGNPGCGSGLVAQYGGALSLTAQTGFYGGGGVSVVLVVPVGKSLCAITSATIQYSGWLTAAQF